MTISTPLQDDWTDVEDVVHFYSLNGHGRYLDVTDLGTRGRALEHGLGKNVLMVVSADDSRRWVRTAMASWVERCYK